VGVVAVAALDLMVAVVAVVVGPTLGITLGFPAPPVVVAIAPLAVVVVAAEVILRLIRQRDPAARGADEGLLVLGVHLFPVVVAMQVSTLHPVVAAAVPVTILSETHS
jgi:hypothetical protein